MPYCTASAQHKDLADVAALEQSYEFCIAVWCQQASSMRRGSAPNPTILQHRHGEHRSAEQAADALCRRERRSASAEGYPRNLDDAHRTRRILARASATGHQEEWQDLEGVHSPHDLCFENNAQAGLLMQMFITYAQGQRADANHPPAQTMDAA